MRYQKPDAASHWSSDAGRSVTENTISPCVICCRTSPFVKKAGVVPYAWNALASGAGKIATAASPATAHRIHAVRPLPLATQIAATTPSASAAYAGNRCGVACCSSGTWVRSSPGRPIDVRPRMCRTGPDASTATTARNATNAHVLRRFRSVIAKPTSMTTAAIPT